MSNTVTVQATAATQQAFRVILVDPTTGQMMDPDGTAIHRAITIMGEVDCQVIFPFTDHFICSLLKGVLYCSLNHRLLRATSSAMA